MKINYLDLFSGCGGFRKGLEEAGFTFGWEGHSEINKYANKVYEKHFPESEALGDIKSIRPENLPKIDLITFGFPCQDLSIAGKGGGLEASRSGLFYEAMRLVRATKPDYFIFENVKNLFSNRGGLDWFNVLREIADSGYDGQWQLLNTRWFLPQNRERIYFVGFFRGRSRPKIFPVGESNQRITASQGETQGKRQRVRSNNSQNKVANTISARYYKDGSENLLEIKIPEATKQGYAIAEEGDSINLNVLDSKIRRGRVRKGEANTLDTGQQQYTIQRHPLKFLERNQKNIEGDYVYTIDSVNTGGINTPMGIRRLTPVECARLQGFPDDWHGDVSDTQAYKMYGNAVSVPVVKAVAEKLLGI